MPKATIDELLKILRESSQELARLLAVEPVQLSLPTDGKGARIKVSVRKGRAAAVPHHVDMVIGGREVAVPLEVAEDYQSYAPL